MGSLKKRMVGRWVRAHEMAVVAVFAVAAAVGATVGLLLYAPDGFASAP